MLEIMDFGLAKILEAVRLDGPTVIAGTPFSMPPEQASGNIADGRTDLGVTLFELSTGRLPFKEGAVGAFLALGGDVAAAHERHRSHEHEPSSEYDTTDPHTALPSRPELVVSSSQHRCIGVAG